MFANLDYTHHEVVDDVKNWGVWVTNELSLKGFRLDAVRHVSILSCRDTFGRHLLG